MSNPSSRRERTPLYTFARAVCAVAFRSFLPVRYHHRENLSLDAPYIVIANHQSLLDPLIVAYMCKKYEIRFLGKKELSQKKWAAWILERLHMIAVDRHHTDLAAMRLCTKALQEGRVLGIFPEGTRHVESLMSHIETGTSVLALRARVPLVPVFIQKKQRFLKMNHVYIGPAMDISDLADKGFDTQTIDQLTERIRDTFFRMQADTQKTRE